MIKVPGTEADFSDLNPYFNYAASQFPGPHLLDWTEQDLETEAYLSTLSEEKPAGSPPP